jgi:glycosyltransferase involved in cell wall biosynthesis
MKLSIILPCRNEEKTLAICITKIRKAMSKLREKDYEIIVSDSSTDSSPKIAKKMGVKLLKHNKEGYGAAYIEAFKIAKGDIIIMGDADNTYDFTEIPPIEIHRKI